LRLFTVLRPGDPPKVDKAISYVHSLLADPRRYDLGDAGRYKLNDKLSLSFEQKTLLGYKDGTFVDFGLIPTLQYLVQLQAGTEGYGEDDIDHLGNRRIRTVGELVADQIRVGLGRMARGVRERMLLGNPDAATPQKLVNNRPIVAALREFFGRSQLSQFKDQVNPLSELRHKRRISALGPGGLTRERAGFDVRDVHRTHYGRICPIETPEGANIGLITSLASFSRVNPLGFIEAPYRRVQDGIGSPSEVVYMTAHDEDRYIIAQANTPLRRRRAPSRPSRIVARKLGDPVFVDPTGVDFMDVSPKQIISIPTAFIPFLEHDDANRALMGSNMQSQAVPLHPQPRRRSSAPASRSAWRATRAPSVLADRRPATVTFVDATRVVVDRRQGRGATSYEHHALPALQPEHQPRPAARWFALGQQDRARPGARRRSGLGGRATRARSRTSSSPSCPSTATTSRTPSSSPSAWCVTTRTPRSTSRSSRRRRATPSSGRRRSRATSRASPRQPFATSTRTAWCASAPSSSRATSWWATPASRGRRTRPPRSACCGRSSARRRAR
jgi:DNA-directed RNA polymerase subunit beta